MIDKRRYVRLDTELALTFERKGLGSLKGEATVKNVSARGLCFVSKISLGVGEKIYMTLTLPKESRPIALEGRVKWVQPLPPISSFEIGVELTQTTSVDENQFLLFVCDLMCERLTQMKLL